MLLAGCASDRTFYDNGLADTGPVDLIHGRANTHPEMETGLNHYAGENTTVDERLVGVPVIIEEGAGAERFYQP